MAEKTLTSNLHFALNKRQNVTAAGRALLAQTEQFGNIFKQHRLAVAATTLSFFAAHSIRAFCTTAVLVHD